MHDGIRYHAHVHTFFLCENERSPRRLVEIERVRGELRRRRVPSRVIAWRDRDALPRDAVVILAMERSDETDRAVAQWLRSKRASGLEGLVPSRDLALSALQAAGLDRLVPRGVSCSAPEPSSPARSAAARSAAARSAAARSAEDYDAVTSVYLVGDVCTHSVRRIGGVVRPVTLGTSPLLLASQAREAFIEESSSARGRAAASLGAPYVRVDLRAGADGELEVVGVDPILHGVAAHLHPPIIARLADAVCAALSERLAVGAFTPQESRYSHPA